MKQKSLKQLAREIGVSHSYLSQIRHGKRPASARVVSILGQNGKRSEVARGVPVRYNFMGEIAELCSGSTGDFGSLSPGSNPGSAAIILNLAGSWYRIVSTAREFSP